MVTLEEFAIAVSHMRRAQLVVKKHKTLSLQRQQDAAEQEVDQLLTELSDSIVAIQNNIAQQGRLFDNEPKTV